MKLLIIKENTPEWHYMWNWLADHPINSAFPEPMVCLNEKEAWQYMGSFRSDKRIIHEFRHRNHPLTNDLLNLKVSGSEAFTEDSILPKK